MHSVTVEPAGLTFDVADGETILAAAERSGLRWPTVCGGKGTCRTCILGIVAGGEHFAPVGPWEQEGLDEMAAFLRGPRVSRMACQATVQGDVVVRKPGVRPRSKETS